MEKVWIEVRFNGLLMDDIQVYKNEAEEIKKSIEKNGFTEYNEAVKTDWLQVLKFKDNPTVTTHIIAP